jgi:hypothetical protein
MLLLETFSFERLKFEPTQFQTQIEGAEANVGYIWNVAEFGSRGLCNFLAGCHPGAGYELTHKTLEQTLKKSWKL